MSLSRISTSSKERMPETINENQRKHSEANEKRRESGRDRRTKKNTVTRWLNAHGSKEHTCKRDTRGATRSAEKRERRRSSSDRKHRSSLFNDDRCFLMITNAKKKDGVFPHNYWLVGLQAKLNVFHTSSVSFVSKLVFEIE